MLIFKKYYIIQVAEEEEEEKKKEKEKEKKKQKLNFSNKTT
jgi:hypothetical protein